MFNSSIDSLVGVAHAIETIKYGKAAPDVLDEAVARAGKKSKTLCPRECAMASHGKTWDVGSSKPVENMTCHYRSIMDERWVADLLGRAVRRQLRCATEHAEDSIPQLRLAGHSALREAAWMTAGVRRRPQAVAAEKAVDVHHDRV